MSYKKNSNGIGSVYYDNRTQKWRGQFTDPHGKRRSKSFETHKEAQEWVASMTVEIRNKTYIEPSKITLGEYIIKFIDDKLEDITNKTVKDYTYCASLLKDISSLLLQDIKSDDIKNFLKNGKLSASNRVRVYCFLRQVFKQALADQLVKVNIMNACKRPKYKQLEIETFSRSEIHQLLNWLKNSKRHKRYYPLILFAVTSGCRMGEILGLKIHKVFTDHVKIDNSLEEIGSKHSDKEPKTEASIREISLPLIVIEEIKTAYYSMPNSQANGYVFHTATGNPISNSNLEKTWKRILELANLSHRHFHALRHTHATELLFQGIPLLEVSKRLGHENPNITLRFYGHAVKQPDIDFSNTVSNIFIK